MNIAGAGRTLSLFRSIFNTSKQTLSPIEFSERKPLLKPDENKFFKRVSPEECGIESRFLYDYAYSLFEDRQVNLQSLMVMRNDCVEHMPEQAEHTLTIKQ